MFGWDGVGNQLLMSALLPSTQTTIDGTTWVFAGTAWIKASPPLASTPLGDGNRNSLLVYDSDRHRDVLIVAPDFAVGSMPTQGTWEWDGSAWTKLQAPHAPVLLPQPSAAYSPELHLIVMLDAEVAATGSNNGPTYLFDGNDWRVQETAQRPQVPAHVEYDPVRHSIVALSLSDFRTWSYDGQDWLALSPAAVGAPCWACMGRQEPAFALDQKRDVWVGFGGNDGYAAVAETWNYGGVTWTGLAPITSPPARSQALIWWDTSRGSLVLFGGWGRPPRGRDLGDTWSWDGDRWTQLAGPTYP